MSADFSVALIEGPWRHEFVSANGCRFHVTVAGPESSRRPLVLLLHTFPEFWWAWRHQIAPLAEAGYRVAAMDLRGVGASDKPPLGYDAASRSRDVAGVIRSLGATRAVVVGHGLGGMLAWAMPSLQPAVTAAVAALSAPHPARLHASMRQLVTSSVLARLALLQVPGLPERALATGTLAEQLLREWGGEALDDAAIETYRTALRIPFAARGSLEALRWVVRSAPRIDGRRFLSVVRRPISLPVLQVQGAEDTVLRPAAVDLDSGALCSELRFERVPEAGHLVHEEAPEVVTGLLLEWLEESVMPGEAG